MGFRVKLIFSKVFLWIISACFFFVPVQAFGSVSKPLEVTAQKVEAFNNFKILVAEGDVVIQTNSMLIWAQKAKYEVSTRYLILYQYKIFDFTKNATLEGDQAFLDLRNEEFWGQNIFMFLKKEGIRIKAKDLHKNALNEYLAKSALVTSCEFDCENEKDFPPWSLEVREFVLTPEGISKGEATKFKIKKQTVVSVPKTAYVPKVTLPMVPQRSTGFLFPKIIQGNRLGLGLQLPFFWPYTDQVDFTLSPMFLTKRGLLLDLESQFRLIEPLEGVFKLRYLKDNKKTLLGDTEKEEEKKHKWWFVGKIDYTPKPNLDFHLDIDVVSNKDFLEEFDIGENGFSSSKTFFLERFHRTLEEKNQEYRTSRFWAQYYRGSLYSRIESSYLDYHGASDKDTVLQPLWGFRLNLLPFKTIGNLMTNFSLVHNYSFRKEGYYGHKLSSNLEIAYPFKTSFLLNEFKASYFLNHFILDDSTGFSKNSLNNHYYDVSFTTYTQIFKFYEVPLPLNRNLTFLHVLKPYVTYYFKKKPSETNIPVFTYEDLSDEEINTLEYGLWQLFRLKNQPDFLRVKVYQQYQFNVEETPTATSSEKRKFSDLGLQVLLNYTPHLSLRYDGSYNFYGLGFKKHSFDVGLTDWMVDRVGLTFQDDKAWNTRQLTLSLSHRFFQRLQTDFYLSRNLRLEENTEMRLGLSYVHDCYLLGGGVSVTPKDTKFFFRVELKGLGGYGLEK